MAIRLDTRATDFAKRFRAFLDTKREAAADVEAAVRAIVADVAARGDQALYDYTRRFDQFDLKRAGLRVTEQEIAAAVRSCEPRTLDALSLARGRIEQFHRRQIPQDDRFTDALGVELGARWTAIEAVGLYVPGGTAAYPSSVLMNAVPAKVAGVPRLAMVVPAPGGELSPLVLAAAKRLVFGKVGIDMIAGPSEVLILADKTGNADWIAADLLAQAEHDASAQSILITDDATLASRVEMAVDSQLKTLSRGNVAAASWNKFGAVIVVPKLSDAVTLVDQLAPEHLEIMSANADELVARIRNAGAIFIGAYTPEAIGDYVAGSNHVLPTARSARFSSGLGVLDFMKRTSLLKCGPEQLRALGPAAIALGQAEGLSAHARSIAMRLNQK